LFTFHWTVPELGFEWLEAKPVDPESFGAKQAEFLTACRSAGGQLPRYRSYDVFAETGLFRTFAGTKTTKDGIVGFANNYGLLGGGVEISTSDEYRARGQYFEGWVEEIEAMKEVVMLWDAIGTGDVEFLSKFIRWDRHAGKWYYVGPEVPFHGGRRNFLIDSPIKDAEVMALLIESDPILPANLTAGELVNRKLRQHGTMPRLVWHKTKGQTFQMVPKSLIAALWIQTAKAIEGNRKYRQCDECQKWFEVAGDRRADARFCSDACRFKSYRKRREEAGRLSKEGLAVKEIAKRLGSDVKTVRGWIG
jgi:hypothetical protein